MQKLFVENKVCSKLTPGFNNELNKIVSPNV